MRCNKCGQTIHSGMDHCPNCGTAAEVMPEKTGKTPAGFKHGAFFALGLDLSDTGKSESEAVEHPQTDDGNGSVCVVCGARTETHLCSKCSFDSSCDYERYPTLQPLSAQIPAVSLLKSQWEAPAGPSVKGSILALRCQGWEKYVLSAVEMILKQAADGTFTEQHHIEICADDGSVRKTSAPIKHETPAKTSRFCAVCGTANKNTSTYCAACGVKLNALSSKTAVTKNGIKQPANTKTCKHCGGRNTRGSIYCTLCGTKVE